MGLEHRQIKQPDPQKKKRYKSNQSGQTRFTITECSDDDHRWNQPNQCPDSSAQTEPEDLGHGKAGDEALRVDPRLLEVRAGSDGRQRA